MAANALVIALALPFVGWRLYRRAKRNIGRQRSKLWRHWTAAIVFPLLLTLFALLVHSAPLALYGLLAGALTGAALGRWGITLTRFEKTPEGAFYTPNPYLGTSIVALFALRILYRFWQLFTDKGIAAGGTAAPAVAPAAMPAGDPWAAMEANFAASGGLSPFTLFVFGLLMGYYASYAIGLLRWRHGSETLPPVTT